MIAQLDADFIRARPAKLWPRLLAYFLFEGRPLTTKGRWINPLVFLGYRLWPLLPAKVRTPAPILILGAGRSGTTVLGKVLGLHKDAGFLNEPKALWQAALGDDDLIAAHGDGSADRRIDLFPERRGQGTWREGRAVVRHGAAFVRVTGSAGSHRLGKA